MPSLAFLSDGTRRTDNRIPSANPTVATTRHCLNSGNELRLPFMHAPRVVEESLRISIVLFQLLRLRESLRAIPATTRSSWMLMCSLACQRIFQVSFHLDKSSQVLPTAGGYRFRNCFTKGTFFTSNRCCTTSSSS